MFNISTRKVGGIRFVKLGRLCVAFSLARDFRPMKDLTPRHPVRLRTNGARVFIPAEVRHAQA